MKKRLHEIIILFVVYSLIIPSTIFAQNTSDEEPYYRSPVEVGVNFSDFIKELMPWTALWGGYLIAEHFTKKALKDYAKKITRKDPKTLERLNKLKNIAYGFSFKAGALSLIAPLALLPYSTLASASYHERKEYEELSQSYSTYFRYYFMRKEGVLDRFNEVITTTKNILKESNKRNGLIKKSIFRQNTRVGIDLEKLNFLISPFVFHLTLDGYNIVVPFHYFIGKSIDEASIVLAYDTVTLLAKKLLPQFRSNHRDPLYSAVKENEELLSTVKIYFNGVINPPRYLVAYNEDEKIKNDKTPWEIAIDNEETFNKSFLTSPFSFLSRKEIEDNQALYTLNFRFVKVPRHDYAWLTPCERESNQSLLVAFDKELSSCESIPLSRIFSEEIITWLDKENTTYQERIKNIDHNLDLIEGTSGGILALAMISLIFGGPVKKTHTIGNVLWRFLKSMPKKVLLFTTKAVLFIGVIIGVSTVSKEYEIAAATRTSLLNDRDEINALNDFVSWYKRQNEIYQSGRKQFVSESFMDTFFNKLERMNITLNFINKTIVPK